MTTNRDNFRSWFAEPIRLLAKNEHAGSLIAMVTFPLLERYLRQATKTEPCSDKFITALRKVLPELRTDEIAKVFWDAYRNGLLHNVTMKHETHGLTHDSRIVEVQSDGRVWLNPVLFSEHVIATIEADFATYERGIPLPVVSFYGCVPEQPGAASVYKGTSTPPGQGKI